MPKHTTHAIKCNGCGKRIGRWGTGFFRFTKDAATRTRCRVCPAPRAHEENT